MSIKNNTPQPDNTNPSAKNALVHGCYAKDSVLPWESQDEFDEMHRHCREHLNPHGVFEEEAVWDVTLRLWWKRRLIQNYTRRFICDPLAEDLTRAAEQGADGIETYLRDRVIASCDELKHGKSYSWSHHQVTARMNKLKEDPELQKAMHDEMVGRGTAVDEATQTSSEAPEAVQRELEERTKRVGLRAIERIEQQELAEACANGSIKPAVDRLLEQNEMVRASQTILDRLDRPEDFDAFLKRLGSLDAQIDKAVAKVARLKEYARLYGSKTVDGGGATET